MKKGYGKILTLVAIFVGVLLSLRWALPLIFPFLLGAGLAWLAEPMTQVLCRRLPRGLSAAVSVTLAFCFFTLLVLLAAALLVKQLSRVSLVLPVLEDAAVSGIATLSSWLQALTRYLPEAVGTYLRAHIQEFFSGGSAMLDQATAWLLGLAGTVLSRVPDSALGLGTALISSYMIAAKLPRIREFPRRFPGASWVSEAIAGLRGVKTALGGWLLAQVKLCAITFCVLTVGFWILAIPHAPLWAGVVSLVDAFPVLGTGTVLIPWSLVCLLRGNTALGIGLLGVYVAAFLIRSVLEPRLVGKQLGLDPLVTLMALYMGYKLWGLAGMLLAPLAAVAALRLLPRQSPSPEQ